MIWWEWAAIVSVAIVVILGSIWLLLRRHDEGEATKKEKEREKGINNKKFREAKVNYYNNLMETGEKYSWKEIYNNEFEYKKANGVYALYFMLYDLKETIPLYVGSSEDMYGDWKRIQNEMLEDSPKTRNKYFRVIKFCNENNLNVSSINFIVLEKTENQNKKDIENKYIQMYGSKEFGFN